MKVGGGRHSECRADYTNIHGKTVYATISEQNSRILSDIIMFVAKVKEDVDNFPDYLIENLEDKLQYNNISKPLENICRRYALNEEIQCWDSLRKLSRKIRHLTLSERDIIELWIRNLDQNTTPTLRDILIQLLDQDYGNKRGSFGTTYRESAIYVSGR